MYVVSRSGKVLDSSGRVLEKLLPEIAPDLTHALPLALFQEQPASSFFNLAATLVPPGEKKAPVSSKRKHHQIAAAAARKPMEGQGSSVWEDEILAAVDDIARSIPRRNKSSRRKQHFEHIAEAERHRRLAQHLKIGISQMFILQRWESGSRELPAKWASWLLKMLRIAKPLPQALQKFLFTVLAAVLPVICCGLVCQTLSILPDSEVLKAVDTLCSALEKSCSCFSAFQWEILKERIDQCQQVRFKAGTWVERTRTDFPLLTTAMVDDSCSSISSSSDEYPVSNNEQMSNELVLLEGVTSLVRRALKERQIFTHKTGLDNSEAVSMICPLSEMRIKIPARGIFCTHLTCFDLECYLKANEELASSNRTEDQTSMWKCPFCASDASWPQIIVDGCILRILKSLPENVSEVVVWPDGRRAVEEVSGDHHYSKRKKQLKHSTTSEEEFESSPTGFGGNQIQQASSRDSESSRKDTGRSVRPRLEIPQTMEVASQLHLSGNEATAAATEAGKGLQYDIQAQDTMNQDAADLVAVPVLHEINLRSLIQSALKKAVVSGESPCDSTSVPFLGMRLAEAPNFFRFGPMSLLET